MKLKEKKTCNILNLWYRQAGGDQRFKNAPLNNRPFIRAKARYFQLGTDAVLLSTQLQAVNEIKTKNGWRDWATKNENEGSRQFKEFIPSFVLKYKTLFADQNATKRLIHQSI